MSFKSEVKMVDGVWSINGMPPEQVKLVMEKQPDAVKRNMVCVAATIGVSALVLCTTYAMRWASVNAIQRACDETDTCGKGVYYDQ